MNEVQKQRLERYEKYLSEMRLSKSTRETYIRQAKNLENLCTNETAMDGIEEYAENIKEKHKTSTVNLYFIAANKYLKFLGRNERITLIKVQKKQCIENVISKQEYEKMMQYAKETGRRKYYLIMQTLANTGIRVSELSYLQANNITDGHITVYNKGKSREIFIPDLLVRQLEQYCIDSGINSGAIFRGNTEKAISRCAIWQMLQRIADMLGITKEKAHPHSFRHFFGKRYITKFGDLSELADILGHSSIEITRIYTRSTVEEKRMKMNELLND